MKCKLSLVAKEIIIANDTGVPSAINILEGIKAGGFPLFVQEICFLTVWAKQEGDPDEHQGHMIVEIGGKELVREKFTVSFGDKEVARNVAKFQGLVLPSPGELNFVCEFPAAAAKCTVTVSTLVNVETTATK